MFCNEHHGRRRAFGIVVIVVLVLIGIIVIDLFACIGG